MSVFVGLEGSAVEHGLWWRREGPSTWTSISPLNILHPVRRTFTTTISLTRLVTARGGVVHLVEREPRLTRERKVVNREGLELLLRLDIVG